MAGDGILLTGDGEPVAPVGLFGAMSPKLLRTGKLPDNMPGRGDYGKESV